MTNSSQTAKHMKKKSKHDGGEGLSRVATGFEHGDESMIVPLASDEQIEYYRALSDLIARARMPQTAEGISQALKGLRAQKAALRIGNRSMADWYEYQNRVMTEIADAQRHLKKRDRVE